MAAQPIPPPVPSGCSLHPAQPLKEIKRLIGSQFVGVWAWDDESFGGWVGYLSLVVEGGFCLGIIIGMIIAWVILAAAIWKNKIDY